MPRTVIISGEEDLWALLVQLGQDGELLSKDLALDIQGWSPELLYFPDEVSYSIRPSTGNALYNYHLSLSRGFAYLTHGQARANLLTKEEKEALNLRIQVRPGSNAFNVFEQGLEEIIKAMVGHMTGEQTVATIVIFLLLYFSHSLARYYLSQRLEERKNRIDADNLISLSEEETKRAEIMADALSSRTDLKVVEKTSETGRKSLLKASAVEPASRFLGVPVTQEQAKAALSSDKGEGEGMRMDGRYEVVDVGIENPAGWESRFRNLDNSMIFDAQINRNDLTTEDIDCIFDSVREKFFIRAQVNAWVKDGKVQRAIVMRAEKDD